MKHVLKIRKKPPKGGLRIERYALFIPIVPIPAPAVNVQGMVAWREVVQFACSPDDLFDPGITKLDDISGVHIDEVVMLHAVVCLFELGDVLAELVLDHQVTVQQEFNGVVQGGPADAVILVLHEDVEGLDIEVPVPGIDLIQDGIPFRGFTVTFSFQILREYLFYSIFRLLMHHN